LSPEGGNYGEGKNRKKKEKAPQVSGAFRAEVQKSEGESGRGELEKKILKKKHLGKKNEGRGGGGVRSKHHMKIKPQQQGDQGKERRDKH